LGATHPKGGLKYPIKVSGLGRIVAQYHQIKVELAYVDAKYSTEIPAGNTAGFLQMSKAPKADGVAIPIEFRVSIEFGSRT